MVDDKIHNNAEDLEKDLQWFQKVLDARIKGSGRVLQNYPPLELAEDHSLYASFINHYELTPPERLLLVLSLVPHLRPQLLDPLFRVNDATGKGHSEYGGLTGHHHGGFLPTGETLMFLAAGSDLGMRIRLQQLFETDHFFSQHGILKLESPPDDEPFLSGQLVISKDYLDYFTVGTPRKPDLSSNFPAKRIATEMEWEDLVLEDRTMKQLEDIKAWLEYGNKLMHDWEMSKKLRKGYRCLFYGPPGTGKTLTARLLGKFSGRDVYRIDLSLVVSKYIGETEKNLSKIFNQAGHKDWILFFDEADALFGKRTSISDAHDRYANQEVSYLLQRIEDHDGLVVLASNMKENLDDSFTRRFESVIHFPLPRTDQRLRIWKGGIPGKARLAPDVDLEELAEKYDVSGGTIMNAVAYASLMTLKKQKEEISKSDLLAGIRKEYEKEGRTL